MVSRKLVTTLCYLALIHVSFGQRVFKAHEATPHSNPYMAGIIKDNDKYDRCGGALIHEEFVLTAAECVVGYLIDVILGAHDILAYEVQKQQFRIPEKNKIVHPQFNENTLGNNIALIKLPAKVAFNTYIQKINMAPDDSELFIGESTVFAGWGIAGFFYMASKLQQVELTVLGNNRCKFYRRVEPTEMCTNPYVGYIGMGNRGNAGNPLILQKNKTDVLIGLASNKPSILKVVIPLFLRISSYRKWIDESMANATKITVTSSTSGSLQPINPAVTGVSPITTTSRNDLSAETTVPTTTTQSTEGGQLTTTEAITNTEPDVVEAE